jgi:protein-tyrosine phosphatase
VIDLHSHILPGIDDGPPDMAGAVALARAAVADGTEILAATPHIREDHPDVHLAELADRCAQVNEALALEDIPLEVVVGAEVDVVWTRTASDEDLRLATYGQRGEDMLLETPYGPLPPGFEDWVFSRLSLEGIRVMLAHPERNMSFQQSPERLAEMVSRGVLVQVTAGSLAGRRKSESRKLARWMVEDGLAHVIASDAHRASEFRPPLLSVGVEAGSHVDETRARWMVTDAPRAVLAGEPLPPMPEVKRRGRLGGLLGG